MHPEIRQVGPGNCPICGMALEPVMPTLEEDDSELRAVQRRFWISLVLTLPVVGIAMVPHLLDLHLSLGQQQAASHGQYCESASHASANDRAPAPCLPQQFARELYDLALSGDVLGLTGRLASFEESESLPVPIVAELRTLARNFDMKSIRTVLRPIAKA